MCAAVLEFNALNCIFGLKANPCLVYFITQEGIKPDLKKLRGVLDLGRSNTTNEVQALIRMFQYCMDMCPRRSCVLSLLIEAGSVPKVIAMIWNDNL